MAAAWVYFAMQNAMTLLSSNHRTFSHMTLIYIKNSIGPITELYDTPDVTYMMSNRAPLTDTLGLRFDRKN